MNTDPISDYLTRIRNAQMANHKVVDIPYSNIKYKITEILKEQGYISDFKVVEDTFKNIRIALKYRKDNGQPAILKLRRISKPGLRTYSKHNQMRQVINGLGISIVSTSQGLMIDKKAREKKIGGEVICEIY